MGSRQSITHMRGFTLLEIMVALAVFATLASAVLSASQYVVKQTAGVEERVFAAWLADNQLNEMRLQTRVAVGQQQWVVQMDRRDWWLHQTISAASDPDLLNIDIRVTLPGREHTLYRASGWLANRHE